MLVLKLWNYMRGYVVINIEGLTLERFINMCTARNIYLWDVKRIDNITLEAKIGIKGFRELKDISKRLDCKILICKKRGYPFWIHKLKRRKMLIIGAFFCFLLLVFASTFIFSIEITGNENVEKAEIMSRLNTLGLKPGTNKYFINLRNLENQMLLEIEQLAWVGIEIEGIRARIEVVEKILPPDEIDKDVPCDVVAKKSGVIEKIITRNGYTVVKEGDIVKKGDILISGIVLLDQLGQIDMIEDDQIGDSIPVHAYGEIYAKTYYEAVGEKNLTEIKKKKTGEKLVRKTFNLGGLEISLNKGEIPYESYVVEKKTRKFLEWRKIKFPVELVIEEYHEVNEIETIIDEVRAKNYIHKNALDSILEKMPSEAEILNTQIDFNTKDGVLYGKVIVEALENIAVKRILQTGED